MTLKEAMDAICEKHDNIEVGTSDWNAGMVNGLAAALEILRSVEGAWVDVSGDTEIKSVHRCLLMRDSCCNHPSMGFALCPCKTHRADIGKHADCPAVIPRATK